MNKKLTCIITLALLMINGMALAQDPPAHVKVHGNVYGGGNKAVVMGSSSVLMNKSNSDTILGDVYGGGALAHVNATMTVSGSDTTYTYNEGTATHVTILQGVINGNVYGGGLGDSISYGGSANIAALVHGKVYVNIGNDSGGPTLNGSVFGCNNINGTPLDSVFVNIYKTAHTTFPYNNYYPTEIDTFEELETSVSNPDDPNYINQFAIAAVYGGGNKASYKPNLNGNGDPKCTTVHVFDCFENTIQTIYGGGNAANVGDTTDTGDTIFANTRLIIEGGRYDQVFGGGNGYSATHNHDQADQPNYNPGANIFGTALTDVQGGLYRQVFGGSNQYGNIATVALGIDNQCNVLLIYESFGGANEADITGNINTTLYCNTKNYEIGNFYGGSNKADIDGNVTLNVLGGQYQNVFGGSKGTLPAPGATQEQIAAASADISGAVTLNLHGGTMENAFGGSDVFGSILGAINVNVWDTVANCQLQVDTVYGGGRDAAYTPSLVNGEKIVSPIVNLWNGTVGHGSVNGCVFGGGKGGGAYIAAHPKVMIGDTISSHNPNNKIIVLNGNIFGGGNAAVVDGIDSVLMLKANSEVVNLFGGGNAAEADTAVVIMHVAATLDTIFGGGNLAGLDGTALVDVSNGTVKGGIYGGSNKSGTIADNIIVNVTGNASNHTTVGAANKSANIHGGGYGASTRTNGNVTVNFGDNPDTRSEYPKVYGDIYGGSALGWVNDGNDTTMVNILNGEVKKTTSGPIVGGNVYGGGLGQKQVGETPGIAALVNGKVFVNIGDTVVSSGTISYRGKAVIEGDVFGCNNLNGSPQDSVFVNVFQTDHGNDYQHNLYPSTPPSGFSEWNDPAALAANAADQNYAIEAIFGGGNEASYTPTLANGEPRSTTVHVFNCQSNTIKDVYGGGNAADVGTGSINANTFVVIDGGRINRVFGGGKGEAGGVAANIYGTATTTVYAGLIDTIFGGSNQNGSISDAHLVLATESGSCEKLYNQVFGGANIAEISGNVNTTINCGVGRIGDIYGGSNLADITGTGNVTLNIKGGIYNNVFGGSRGSSSNGADISGNVELNLEGGTMTNAFGGSNVKGNIAGKITVKVEDTGICSLVVDTIYGGGQKANYTPNLVAGKKIVSPVVNLLKGTVGEEDGSHVVTVAGCVFGGGKEASVTAHPKVVIGDTITGHGSYVAKVLGNVFGGGNLATVDGIDSVLMLKGNSQVVNLFGGGNRANADSTVVMMTAGIVDTIFGGGNLAGLTGTSKIVMTNGKVNKGIFGGCNASGTVSGEVTLEVNGGAVGAENALAYGIFGGGYGSATTTSNNISVTLNGTTVYGDLYGGSALGQVNGSTDHTTTLNISGSGLHGTIYGGGKGQASPAITAITNGNVVVNYNTANTYLIDGIYGGANIKGNVKGNIDVNVNANVGASGNSRNIFGGGLGQNTMTEGNVTVTIGTADGSKQPVIYGDIYGGSALGNVNDAASDLTKIDFLNGTLHGNIFGGGLGQKTPTPIAAKVNGSVEVNISNVSQLEDQCHIDLRDANIYGCNNTNGSPQANVTVNVWKTGFTTGDYASQTGTLYAIDQVFGGGKQADYLPENAKPDSDKKTTVYIHECKNTIRRVFSGGDAAAATGVACTIEGGRFYYIFGGGNGEATAANIGLGGTDLLVEAGIIEYLFGGSNTSGTISGEMRTTVTGNKYTSGCDENITEFFGGGNLAPINTSITTTMDCGVGTITNIYGGAKQAAITGDITLNIKGGTYTNIFGGSQGIYGGTAANITGNVTLNLYGGTITNAFGGSDQNGNITGQITVNVLDTVTGCPLDVTNIYGGGNVTPYTPTSATISPLVNVMYIKQDAGVKGNVFGGGLGETAKVTANPVVNIGYNASTMSSLVSGMTLPSGFPRAKVTGNVFGGGSQAPVTGSPTVNAYNGSVTKVYGGGLGATAIVTGNPTVIVNQTSGQTLTVTDVFGGGDAAGVTGNTDVQLKAGTVTRAFGGGNVADITGTTTVKLEGATAANIYGGGNEASVSSTTSVTVSSGNATAGVYGGCNTSGNVGGNVTVNVTGGTIGATGTGNEANVHGGGFGNGTSTSGDVNVTINGASATIWGDVYGGSAKGHVNDADSDKTNVTLTAGTIHGDLYGGGLGDNTYAALVNGAVQVTVNGGSVTGSVYGCNNANGAPQSTVKVDIYGTDTPASGYALGNVFGGGNLAGYLGTPEVTIHNCNNSIEFVYGGGNAAPVEATNVKVYGGNTIGNVFGGGNGTGVAADFVMVTGNVLANIYGGTINRVFGGNNSSGQINGTVTLNVNKTTEPGHSSCDMKINEVYGGGNLASGNAGTVTIGCTGTLVSLGSGEHYGIDQEGIRYVYGGANQAGINNDIVLNINSGIVENVFGGNNTSGTIAGSIKVNINKDNGASCVSDWYVGNVYGGGNLAKYTAPTSGSYTGKYPEVNILNGLVSGDVFGGGLGQTGDAGQVTGDPQVTVNGTDASVNGSVYGGGSLAPTKGNPLVTLTTGTVTKVFGGGKAADVDGTPTVDINGGQVNTGVYGGCDSQGDVKGKITVNVKNGTLGSAANLALPTPVTVDVYGGGYGAATTTSGDVEVNIGECTSTNVHSDYPMIYGDVYGGSALGKVNGSNANTTTVNVLNGRLYTFAESATTANGQTYYKYHGGNVYGGGLGDRVGLGTGHSNVLAEENGKIIVNIGASGGSKALAPDTNIGEAIIDGNVYGCNNTNGSPQDDVTVNIYRTHREETDIITYTGPLTPTFALNDVFGGGNQADYNPTATGKKSTVMIHGCHNTIQRVFGGSNAAASGSSSIPVEVKTNINGGRFNNVFGGGNGEVSAANIFGDVRLEIHGGIVDEFFVGSNQEGSISGSSNVTVDQSSGCDEITITEFYCGGKYADYVGDINVEISCSQGLNVNYLYGGCKEAHVRAGNGGSGNVHLVVKGGTYDYIFGGSRGTTEKGADIQGNVLLEVYGGTVNNAIFGGSNVKGAIGGTITVNVEDKFPNDDCALEVSTADVYGGGNQADYPGTASAGSPLSGTITHTPPYNYPAVNIKNATVKNVFGGGLEAEVKGNPQIKIKKGSKISGNVYGGGNMGEVIGDPKVIINGKLE